MTKEQFKQEANFLILLIDLAYMQLSVFKDNPFITKLLKNRFNLFWNNSRQFSRQMSKVVEFNQCSDQYEKESAMLYDIIREASMSKDLAKTLETVKRLNTEQ